MNMSLSTANLATVLSIPSKLSPDDVARLREKWRQAYAVPYGPRYPILTASSWAAPQNGLPVPFRWGPNGAFLLLLALLALYGVIVAIAMIL